MPAVSGRRTRVEAREVDEEIEAASKSWRGCRDRGEGGIAEK